MKKFFSKKEENREDIHDSDDNVNFSSRIYVNKNKTGQQYWKKAGLTYQDAQEWIAVGFGLRDYDEVKKWKKHKLTSQEAKSLLDVGLTKSDYKFAAYLKQNNCIPDIVVQEKDYAQHWLDFWYPKNGTCLRKNESEYINNYDKTREEITKLSIYMKSLKRRSKKKHWGSLSLAGFVSLEELSCHNNRLTTLDLTNCANLKKADCPSNQLTEIKFSPAAGGKIEWLYLWNNNLNQDLSFLKDLVNLKGLDLRNNLFYGSFESLKNMANLEDLDLSNNKFEQDLSFLQGTVNLEILDLSNIRFHGSLEYLKEMKKLKNLDISNTDLDSGLEYLPESIINFTCSANERKDAKCQTLYNLFTNAGIKVETNEYGRIKNFPQKLREYKQKIAQQKQIQQSKEKVSPQPKTAQDKFKHFLKSYVTEKQAQISHEKDQSKLEFLQEELKILKQLQEKQEQKQIQQIQWELKEILTAYLSEKQEQLTETLAFLQLDYPDEAVNLSGREEVKSIQEEINVLQAELAKEEETNQKQQQELEQEKQQSLQHQMTEIVELEEQQPQILHLGIPASSKK